MTVSSSGRYVSYYSQIEPVGASHAGCIYVRDLSTGATSVVTVNTAGKQSATGYYTHPVISGDGRKVAFLSDATDLVAGATTRVWRLYLRNLDTRTTTLLTKNVLQTYSGPDLAVDGAGSRVVFTGWHPPALPVRSTFRPSCSMSPRGPSFVSRPGSGRQANGPTWAAKLAATGRVAFQSNATNLVSSHLTGVFARTL